MFSCKGVSKRLSESMDCRLPLHQRLMIRMHLAMCRFCRRAYKQLLCLREIARNPRLQEAGMDASVSLSSEACERIKESLCSQDPPS
ncbi:MAG: hypothetical protein AMJ54_01105 [Deltaproteobacteria bacterium SG8_13]|nr:MAG: hypothetical protein AMJ54_01105 [Deltaproteobacteria bacterium SG8_13]